MSEANKTPDFQTIELDAPTAHVLVELLDVALQDDVLIEEPHEHAAFARLLSRIEADDCKKGELTSGVEENTALGGFASMHYQLKLFDYYEDETGRGEPDTESEQREHE